MNNTTGVTTVEDDLIDDPEYCEGCGCVLNYYDPHPTVCVSCEKLTDE